MSEEKPDRRQFLKFGLGTTLVSAGAAGIIAGKSGEYYLDNQRKSAREQFLHAIDKNDSQAAVKALKDYSLKDLDIEDFSGEMLRVVLQDKTAKKSEKVNRLKELFEKGANPDSRYASDGGMKVYFAAAAFECKNDPDLMKKFLDAGLNPNIDELANYKTHFNSLLHSTSNPEVAQMLLEHGADPNIKADNDITPLFATDHPKIIKLLLEAGADPTIKNFQGKNAYENYRDRSHLNKSQESLELLKNALEVWERRHTDTRKAPKATPEKSPASQPKQPRGGVNVQEMVASNPPRKQL